MTRAGISRQLVCSVSVLLALAAAACAGGHASDVGGGTSARDPQKEYDRAVARMIRVNHALEERQAALSFAVRDGAAVDLVAALRREVASLERQYVEAIDAMTAALQRPRAKTMKRARAATRGEGWTSACSSCPNSR